MTPRIAVIAGPRAGETIDVSGDELTIGRDEANALRLAEPLVSRRHCVIQRTNQGWQVADLDSTNGTLVNGVPVKRQRLAHGDQVRVGDSVLSFLLSDAESSPHKTSVELGNNALGAAPLELPWDDARRLGEPAGPAGESPYGRMMRDLRTLVHVGSVVHLPSTVADLAGQLLGSVLEVVPGERAAILLVDEQGEIGATFARSRDGSTGTVPVSRTIVDRVLSKSVAVLSNDLLACEDFSGAPSLQGVRSVLAVPLRADGRKLGAIYVDASAPGRRFDVDHLRLLAAVAGLASGALDRTLRTEQLGRENERLRQDLAIEHSMIGESAPMRAVYEFVAKVAPSDSTVLITGESGTGKELVARAIHRNSPRQDQPFVAINCAALSETLLESELFGHEKGAFTGAVAQKKGKLELASGGTVFLDEIGELAPALQAKLLRALQEREVDRVGGTRPIRIDVRVIAATNRDLAQAVQASTFRGDLYYRINVVSLRTPALRDRREDIPLLARYFVEKFATKCGRRVTGISPAARQCLAGYGWPGNVRELENAIERAVVLGSTEMVLPEDLPEQVLETARASGGAPVASGYHEGVREAKRRLIVRAFEEAQGNHSAAAKLLDVHPNYLHRLLRNMDLRGHLRGQEPDPSA
jgi:Nif-specific regulatory protein